MRFEHDTKSRFRSTAPLRHFPFRSRMTTIADIRSILSRHRPVPLPGEGCTPTAVALILREEASQSEVLFIERALRSGDPWSGDLGFPGGKVEKRDPTLRRTAERETFEETGIDLGESEYLGRLDDIAGAHLPIRVSCFVYALDRIPPLALSTEVDRVFWIPLGILADPRRQVEATVNFGGELLLRPALRLLRPGEKVLWGITYRLVRRFLELLEG
jgi:8-oxo-dGTP pyrophosphatase MutT (NUDIX family)